MDGVLPKSIDRGVRAKSVATQIIVRLAHGWIVIHFMPDVAHFEVKRIAVNGWEGPRERCIYALQVVLLFQSERVHNLQLPLQAARCDVGGILVVPAVESPMR